MKFTAKQNPSSAQVRAQLEDSRKALAEAEAAEAAAVARFDEQRSAEARQALDSARGGVRAAADDVAADERLLESSLQREADEQCAERKRRRYALESELDREKQSYSAHVQAVDNAYKGVLDAWLELRKANQRQLQLQHDIAALSEDPNFAALARFDVEPSVHAVIPLLEDRYKAFESGDPRRRWLHHMVGELNDHQLGRRR